MNKLFQIEERETFGTIGATDPLHESRLMVSMREIEFIGAGESKREARMWAYVELAKAILVEVEWLRKEADES